MSHSDSEEIDNFGNEKEDEVDNEVDVDAEADETDADGELEADTEGLDDESASEEDDSEDADADEDNELEEDEVGEDGENEDDDDEEDATVEDAQLPKAVIGQEQAKKSPSPVTQRSASPAFLRRSLLYPQFPAKTKSYAVEVICALPHPVATHSLASSLCLTHLLTGSEDGYIRDYDVYAACNGKNFLSQPQRQHCGIQEGVIKAPVARMWWENPLQPPDLPDDTPVGQTLSPVYSLLMHSDALWGLSGTSTGTVNLFTVRHDPGRVIHSMTGHLGPVSAMTMLYDEKGFISAGWDGSSIQWDLNTGQKVRSFSHGSQISAVAMRSITRPYVPEPADRIMVSASREPVSLPAETLTAELNFQVNVKHNREEIVPAKVLEAETEAKSEASYDPLFDEPDPEKVRQQEHLPQQQQQQQVPTKEESSLSFSLPLPQLNEASATPKLPVVQAGLIPLSKKAVIPLLDPVTYSEYSTDVFLAASVDGQVVLWDRRARSGRGVGRLEMSEKCPPWCLSACWSYDGSQIYAGRRNGTIDMWDTRILGKNSRDTPRLLKTIRNPSSSGPVSAVVAFPDGNHVACASLDNIRLWNVSEASEGDLTRRATPAFKIIAGHHGGIIAQLLVDVGAKMMISASGNRGWSGDSTRTVLVHDIKTS